MTERSRVQLGSRVRILLPFVDVAEDGTETPINLAGISPTVRIVKPDRSEIEGAELTVTNAAAGEAEWEADEDALDQVGTWYLQGEADGYLSKVESFRVEGNP